MPSLESFKTRERNRWLDPQKLRQIKYAPEHVVGSDRNSNLIMNFQREFKALRSFGQNFQRETGTPFSDPVFLDMVKKWLWDQHMFYLAEHGCGRYLPIQPTYAWQLTHRDEELIMSPVGLQQFGDQSRRFQQVSQIVGKGLNEGYETLATSGVDTWIGIMSPTELYQKWNSKTDVINLMRVSAIDGDTTICEGKYLVLDRVLNTQQRRFVNNLFFWLGKGFPLDTFIYSSPQELGSLIDTNRLWNQGLAEYDQPEFKRMVEYPNSFHHEERFSEDPLYSFATKLNYIFTNRFGEPLISDSDISMYPLIKEIATEQMPKLVNSLWFNPNQDEYYNQLRVMVYQSQEAWGQDQGFSQVELQAYLNDLMAGIIMAGFEVGFDLSVNDLFSNLYTSIWQSPFGFELSQHYCSIHKRFHEGVNCPECEGHNHATYLN